MNITDVRINIKNQTLNKVLASVSITICGVLVITGLQIIDGAQGIFVSMPQYKDFEGKYRDRVYALSKETKEYISRTVLTEYEKQIGSADNGDSYY